MIAEGGAQGQVVPPIGLGCSARFTRIIHPCHSIVSCTTISDPKTSYSGANDSEEVGIEQQRKNRMRILSFFCNGKLQANLK